MDILEEDKDDFDVVLCPPEEKAEAHSDCDSDDSDKSTALFNHFPRRLLASESEATQRRTADTESTNAGHHAPANAEAEEQAEVEAQGSGDVKRSKKRKKVVHNWTKTSQTSS